MKTLTKYAVLYSPRETIVKKKDKRGKVLEWKEVNKAERIVKLEQGYMDCCCGDIEPSYYIFDTKREAEEHLEDNGIHEADKPRVVKIKVTY